MPVAEGWKIIPAHTFACKQDNDISILRVGLFAGLTFAGQTEAKFRRHHTSLPMRKWAAGIQTKEQQAWSESIAPPVTAYDVSMASITNKTGYHTCE